jgi:hypothetical protein
MTGRTISMLCILLHIICKIGWEGLTAISTVALVIIGGLAVGYAKGQLDDFRRESRVKHLIELVTQFEQNPLAEQRRELGRQRTSGNQLKALDVNDPPYELHDILNFFEHMGYLLEENYLDLQGVSTEFHYWIFHIWADAQELVKYEQSQDSIYYRHFRKMVERLAEEEKRRLGKFEFPPQEDVVDFYRDEAHLAAGSPIPRQRRRKPRK